MVVCAGSKYHRPSPSWRNAASAVRQARTAPSDSATPPPSPHSSWMRT